MGFQEPLNLQIVFLHVINDGVSMVERDPTGGVIDVHDGIDDGRAVGFRVFDDVADCICRLVKKGGDVRMNN
jgi:hypothetical protein